MSTAVARMVGFSEEMDVKEDSISFRVSVKAPSRESSAAGEKSFGCCNAYARGRASKGDDFARKRNHG